MPEVPIDDPRVMFVPLEEITTPPSGLIDHIKNRYWIYVRDKGVVFVGNPKVGRSPQCNANKEITERIRDQLYPWAEVWFIPSAFRKVKASDY